MGVMAILSGISVVMISRAATKLGWGTGSESLKKALREYERSRRESSNP
jgi:hypothetical protein